MTALLLHVCFLLGNINGILPKCESESVENSLVGNGIQVINNLAIVLDTLLHFE